MKFLDRLVSKSYDVSKIFLLWTITSCALFCLLLLPYLLYNQTIYFIAVSVVAVFALFMVYLYFAIKKRRYKILRGIAKQLDPENKEILNCFPIPTVVCDGNGAIVWYNLLFRNQVLLKSDILGEDIKERFSKLVSDENEILETSLSYMGKHYRVFKSGITSEIGMLSSYYFIDNTILEEIATKYAETKPCVGYIYLDNYDELTENLRDSERAQIAAQVESSLDALNAYQNAFIIRLRRDRYIIVLEDQHLQKLIESDFQILDNVKRAVEIEDMPLTLSIGIGRDGENLTQNATMARQALDMALGRGGDQAVVKSLNNYEFFGGLSQSAEKRTKVKTRIVSAALYELIENASNVLIMGHKFSDLDSVGSAVGLMGAIYSIGKKVDIVIDYQSSLAKQLVDKMEENEVYKGSFISPYEAQSRIGENTLLIVTDVHVPHLVESADIYKSCVEVVVIDHHRKMVGHIDNAVIFYHEPYASSASEMVTELIQYFGEKVKIKKDVAEALLAGIMLDTKNFVIKTGVRTFEAAAYLRKQGADTVSVRKLFATSLDSYQTKANLVSDAKVIKGCAVVVADGRNPDVSVTSAMAADELLTISGVDASFVLYETDGFIKVSARSLGALNVQTMMEELGGGGHHTQAGANVADSTVEECYQRVIDIINITKDKKAEKKG